jgi:hypothetical protein
MGQLARYSDSQLDIGPEEIDAMRAYFDEWTRRLAERK